MSVLTRQAFLFLAACIPKPYTLGVPVARQNYYLLKNHPPKAKNILPDKGHIATIILHFFWGALKQIVEKADGRLPGTTPWMHSSQELLGFQLRACSPPSPKSPGVLLATLNPKP